MPGLTFTLLNTANQTDIESYERALFRAFYGTGDDSLWHADTEKRRLRTTVAYSDQLIITACVDTVVVAAIACNINVQTEWELEKSGFSINKSEKGICEGLALFTLPDTTHSTMLLPRLGAFAAEHLKSLGIHSAYGSCNPKNMRGYVKLGWQVVDKKLIGNQYEYLMKVIFP